jgi:hypothetical protein
MAKIALRLETLTIDEIITLARRVHDEMSANAATFTDPAVPFVESLTQIDDLQDAQQNMLDGGKSVTVIRNNRLDLVVETLKLQAGYVQLLSKGNAETLQLAGFDLAKRGPRKYLTIDNPVIRKVVNTLQAGEVKLTWTRIKNAKMYQIQVCASTPVTEDAWTDYGYAFGAVTIVTGQPSGKFVSFRVRAMGAAGISDWSAPVEKRVS